MKTLAEDKHKIVISFLEKEYADYALILPQLAQRYDEVVETNLFEIIDRPITLDNIHELAAIFSGPYREVELATDQYHYLLDLSRASTELDLQGITRLENHKLNSALFDMLGDSLRNAPKGNIWKRLRIWLIS